MATGTHVQEPQVLAHWCGMGLLLPSLTCGFICQISSSWIRDMLLSSPTLCPRHAVAAGPDFHGGVFYFVDWDTFCGWGCVRAGGAGWPSAIWDLSLQRVCSFLGSATHLDPPDTLHRHPPKSSASRAKTGVSLDMAHVQGHRSPSSNGNHGALAPGARMLQEQG